MVGLQYGVALGLALGFLNIIPYLGNIVGLGVALPLAYFQSGGGWETVGAVLLVFCAVQAVEAYILTPRIMGSQTGLHPMAIIFALRVARHDPGHSADGFSRCFLALA